MFSGQISGWLISALVGSNAAAAGPCLSFLTSEPGVLGTRLTELKEDESLGATLHARLPEGVILGVAVIGPPLVFELELALYCTGYRRLSTAPRGISV